VRHVRTVIHHRTNCDEPWTGSPWDDLGEMAKCLPRAGRPAGSRHWSHRIRTGKRTVRSPRTGQG
jgi:hypothetical protein